MTERVMAPPKLTTRTTHVGRSDDWSALPPLVQNTQAPVSVETPAPRDPANAGIRQEPAPVRHEDVAPPPKQTVQDFTFTADKSDDEAGRAELLRLRARGLARQVTMDPKNGPNL
jgi:type IV secretion system protein VirD4